MADTDITGQGYAGDVSPPEAWEILEREADAVLIDVRTTAEWTYVGTVDLGSLGKEPSNFSWKIFPAMEVNARFVAEVKAVSGAPETPLLFLCRSGVRSRDAAIAMTAAGYRRCYNIAEGFEGNLDEAGHRGSRGGWKASGLPWMQK